MLPMSIDKFSMPVEGNLPAGFSVVTRSDHGLKVLMEQC